MALQHFVGLGEGIFNIATDVVVRLTEDVCGSGMDLASAVGD